MVFSHGVFVSYFGYMMFVVLFLSGGEYMVKGSEIFLANVGENITMYCNSRSSGAIFWYKGTLYPDSYIASVDIYNRGFLYQEYDNNHFSQLYEASSDLTSLTLSVYNINVEDSANYTCHFNRNSRKTYDVRVIGCMDCRVYPSRRFELDKKDVYCSLINFHGPQLEFEANITVNKNRNMRAFIEKDTLSFIISNTMLYSGISIKFNPYPEKGNLGSEIACIIPPQPSAHHPARSPTQYEHPSTSGKFLSPFTHPTHNSLTNTLSIITTPHYDQQSTSAIQPSSSFDNDKSFTSFAKIPQAGSMTLSNDSKHNPSPTMHTIPITLCFIAIPILVMIVVAVQRFTRVWRQRKHNQQETIQRGSSEDESDKGEPGYESLEGSRRTDSDYTALRFKNRDQTNTDQSADYEEPDKVMCDSGNAITESSFSGSNEQPNIVLYHTYEIPDDNRFIVPESRLDLTDDSPNLVNQYENGSVIGHHKHTARRTSRQYDDINIPGPDRVV